MGEAAPSGPAADPWDERELIKGLMAWDFSDDALLLLGSAELCDILRSKMLTYKDTVKEKLDFILGLCQGLEAKGENHWWKLIDSGKSTDIEYVKGIARDAFEPIDGDKIDGGLDALDKAAWRPCRRVLSLHYTPTALNSNL